MNFTKVEDDINLYCKREIRFTKENIKYRIEIGIAPVMFGWRVLGGMYLEDQKATCADFNLCCGDNKIYIVLIYSSAIQLILNNIDDIKCRADLSCLFPLFEIKPIHNSKYFGEFISVIDSTKPENHVSLSELKLSEWRDDHLNKVF